MAVRKRKKSRAATLRFRLYISDHSPRSLLALANLDRMCQSYLQRGYDVQIIDIRKDPEIATRDNILAVPTLKRISPGSERTVIGSLSDAQVVLKWLGLDASKPADNTRSPADVLNLQQIGRA